MHRDKKFPACFKNFDMPKIATTIEREVYRACPTGKVEPASFVPSYLECNLNGLSKEELENPSRYSLSVDIKYKSIKRFLKLRSHDYQVPFVIAKGVTSSECGKSALTKDYNGGKNKSHVDWWLYEHAEPYKYFKVVENEENVVCS